MFTTTSRRSVLAMIASLGALSLAPAAADAAVVFDGSPGTGEPPATLGGYVMVPIEETRANATLVSNAPLPNGTAAFDQDVRILTVSKVFNPAGWTADWGGWEGKKVYWAFQADDTVKITLPAGTKAFYLYGHAEVFGATVVTATAQDGTSSGPIPVTNQPGGSPDAQFFGFYATGSDVLQTITVAAPNAGRGLAVGRFATDDGTGGAYCDGVAATIDHSANHGGVIVTGTPGDDVIVTGNGDDTVDGAGGNDLICTKGGTDVVRGFTGDDRLFGGEGNDRVQGQAGADEVDGQGGDDDVMGSEGTDTVRGGSGNDETQGGNGDNDQVFGGADDDTVNGGAGTGDACDGEGGTDRTTLNGGCESLSNIP